MASSDSRVDARRRPDWTNFAIYSSCVVFWLLVLGKLLAVITINWSSLLAGGGLAAVLLLIVVKRVFRP